MQGGDVDLPGGVSRTPRVADGAVNDGHSFGGGQHRTLRGRGAQDPELRPTRASLRIEIKVDVAAGLRAIAVIYFLI